MIVKVCDMIMGGGKTQAAVTQMNTDSESKYIFITPYLKEVERIKESCADRHFFEPMNHGEGKLEDLHALLSDACNIASTHALFCTYTDETLRLIREGHYKLILDEELQVQKQIPITKSDWDMLLNEKMIVINEEGGVKWLESDYEGEFSALKAMCETGNVTWYDNYLMVWTYPVEVFEAFDDVIILTYMFDGQFQKYYFDMNGVEVQKIGTEYVDGEYRFTERVSTPAYVRTLRDKIHIVQDRKLNEIGDAGGALSVSWYDRARRSPSQKNLKQLKKNLANVFKNKFSSPTDKNLWTTFKDYKEILKGKGYTKGFLPFNVRATNAYRDRNCLAYCVNVFYNPVMKHYFMEHGVEVKEDDFALSEMIQWIWRSAIRCGEEIWVYVPSKRMRTLLENWLNDMASVG